MLTAVQRKRHTRAPVAVRRCYHPAGGSGSSASELLYAVSYVSREDCDARPAISTSRPHWPGGCRVTAVLENGH